MAAECNYCGLEMTPGTTCRDGTGGIVLVEGTAYCRVPYGPPPDLADPGFLGGIVSQQDAVRALWAQWPSGWPPSCRDCATPQGGLHHPGCDAERCPRCLGQAISCGCHWDGEPNGERLWHPNPESPHARRADPAADPAPIPAAVASLPSQGDVIRGWLREADVDT